MYKRSGYAELVVTWYLAGLVKNVSSLVQDWGPGWESPKCPGVSISRRNGRLPTLNSVAGNSAMVTASLSTSRVLILDPWMEPQFYSQDGNGWLNVTLFFLYLVVILLSCEVWICLNES